MIQTVRRNTDADYRSHCRYADRIRNANSAKHDSVEIPASNLKKAIAEILVEEGYIKSYQVTEDGKQGIIKVVLKYGPSKSKVIQGLRRVSKPGLRVYAGAEDMPKVMRGLGIAILSTSKGVMTDQARKKREHWRRSARLCMVGGMQLCRELEENP